MDGLLGWKLLCDAVNRDDHKPKVYPDIEKWISSATDCYINEWVEKQTNRG